jgi:hypothetical protein
MVSRTITPLTVRTRAEIVRLGLALPIGAERCAHFGPIPPNLQRRLCATRWPSGNALPNYRGHPQKTGATKGGRHGKQYLEAD